MINFQVYKSIHISREREKSKTTKSKDRKMDNIGTRDSIITES